MHAWCCLILKCVSDGWVEGVVCCVDSTSSSAPGPNEEIICVIGCCCDLVFVIVVLLVECCYHTNILSHIYRMIHAILLERVSPANHLRYMLQGTLQFFRSDLIFPLRLRLSSRK